MGKNPIKKKLNGSGIIYREIAKKNGGIIYQGNSLQLINNPEFIRRYKGKINLILTSPPFALNNQKNYGNHAGNKKPNASFAVGEGEEYVKWFSSYAKPLAKLLSKKGSIVVEMGNSWTRGEPTMSLTTYEALKGFMEKGNLKLCQEFIWNNTAKLPGPAQWVTKNRWRAKDSFTKIWWFSKTAYPKANNRKILKPYSKEMIKLLNRQTYNFGKRSSGHRISAESFLNRNKGSIPSNVFKNEEFYLKDPSSVIEISNTSETKYLRYCKINNIQIHDARMPTHIAAFFIDFLTTPGDKVLDPFAGSNTTGYVASRKKRKWVAIELNRDYLRGSLGWFKGKKYFKNKEI